MKLHYLLDLYGEIKRVRTPPRSNSPSDEDESDPVFHDSLLLPESRNKETRPLTSSIAPISPSPSTNTALSGYPTLNSDEEDSDIDEGLYERGSYPVSDYGRAYVNRRHPGAMR